MAITLGFGTAGLSSMPSQYAANRLLKTAFKGGIRHFDTAPLYGKGYAEQMLGSFLAGKRSLLTVTTKFGLGDAGVLPLPPVLALPLNYYRKKLKGLPITLPPGEPAEAVPLTPRRIDLKAIQTILEASLKRLGTDYIDYYLLHEGLPAFVDADARDFLMAKKQQGVIRHLGVATDGYNLQSLSAADLAGWEILQYEAGPYQEVLRKKFPDKIHFIHSVLKYIKRQPVPAGVAPEDWAGMLLARQASTGLADKLLFSTRDTGRLKHNIDTFANAVH
jgi:aryl-alcohol dehydrogenase-like predicted oxidoreductase